MKTPPSRAMRWGILIMPLPPLLIAVYVSFTFLPELGTFGPVFVIFLIGISVLNIGTALWWMRQERTKQ